MATQYHPIRIEAVERLQKAREDANAGNLQRNLLKLMASRSAGVQEIASDRDILSRHRSEEGFDADANAPWRTAVMQEIRSARDSFRDRGRNIFDMTLVADMFRRVDVDDLEITDTPLPFPAVFMHFGPGAGLRLDEQLWIDGAYLREMDADGVNFIALTFVCNHPDHEQADRVPLGTTYKLLTAAATTEIIRDLTVGYSIRTVGLQGDPRLLGAKDVMKQALRMAVNGLLYLNLPKRDIEYAYAADAPRNLVSVATAAKGPRSMQARDELEQLGYVRVNFAGRRTMAAAGNQGHGADGDGHHGSVEPHWRRGHWRRVVVGVGRTGREWRLFPPTVVNRQGGEPASGRIYVVPRPERTQGQQGNG